MSNDAGPLGALLRLLKLQVKGRQRPPPSHLRASGLAIPHALHYCTALLTIGLRQAPLAIIDLEAQNLYNQPYLFCEIIAEISTFSQLLSRLRKMKRITGFFL